MFIGKCGHLKTYLNETYIPKRQHVKCEMIPEQTYHKRRTELMKKLSDDGVIFLHGHSEVPRNDPRNDNTAPFRQSSVFRYFTGVDKSNFSAVLVPKEGKYMLFGPDMGPDMQVWVGTQPSHEEVKEQYCADEIHTPDKVEEIIKSYSPQIIHTLPGVEAPLKSDYVDCQSNELAKTVLQMRLYKDKEEVAEMQEAFDITKQVHEAMMRLTKPGVKECHLKAIADFYFATQDTTYAYPPIVTVKGNILHNQFYHNTLEDGQLLLVDAGAEVRGYASDITRTWPVNGKFTPEQAAVYDIVLQAQLESIDMMKPGVKFKDIDQHSRKVIAEGLREMDVLKGSMDAILENGGHNLFFMHRLGHLLGLDVHDCAGLIEKEELVNLNLNEPLKEGRINTVEPGIYFNEVLLHDPEKVEKYKEFVDFDRARKLILPVSGIRIEDNVLITRKGHKVLGTGIPKQRQELEDIVGSGRVNPFS